MWFAQMAQTKFKFAHRSWVGLACAALLAFTPIASGCKFFDLSNPLLPKARLVAFPEPTLLDVLYTWTLQGNLVSAEPEEVTVRIQSFFNDASPGVVFRTYTAEYYDQTGILIAPLLLSKVDLGVTAYLPPASAQQPANIEVNLPIYNQQVQVYGMNQVFDFPAKSLNRNLIHTINCRITLNGVDDNFNEVEIPVSVPIRFRGNITE